MKNENTLLPERILRHELGSSEADVQVYREPDTAYFIGVQRSKSGKYIIIWSGSTLSNDYQILPADKHLGEFRNFSPRENVHEYSIAHFEDKFYILTNWEARNFRLMETTLEDTRKTAWREVIPHREDVLLESLVIFNRYLVLQERKKGLVDLRARNQETGQEHYVSFDEPAYLASVSVNPEFETNSLRFEYSSLTTPHSTYGYNMDSREQDLKKRQEVVGGHDPKEYETLRLFAPPRDGKEVPLSLVYRKGTRKSGPAPLLLYGYGKMLRKKNTFYDFIDCAEYLIKEGYTSVNRLFAGGGSAGGLLMGAVVNMAPELFKGVISAVPFVDVLTTMSDPSTPLTSYEYDERGNPANEEEYRYIKSYSPYDNIDARDYPNILVMTGLYDSQVQYREPAKWVARLRDRKTDSNRLLINKSRTGNSLLDTMTTDE